MNEILFKPINFEPTNVSAWALKNLPSQKSRYLGTCVLIRHIYVISGIRIPKVNLGQFVIHVYSFRYNA